MLNSIRYILAAGSLMLALAACSKELGIREETPKEVTESLSAVKEDDATKISINGSTLKYAWIPGEDNASFTIYNGETYSFVDSDYYGDTEANKFTVRYTGTRQGFAVTPAAFKGSYDGTHLYVNYPGEYDISARVDTGHYDNCDPSDLGYTSFPMVATSTSGDPHLTFYVIGALVKVVVNDVPKGTKYLYVTFNQTVTGNFPVSNPETNTPSVVVSETSTPSQVKVKISNAGLGVTHTITLYIPVPVTKGLSIVSTTTTKATVARNQGYAFSCDAISRVDASTDYAYTNSNITFAPSNLYAYNNNGVVEYHHRSVRDQVVTTLLNNDNDPHINESTTEPSVASPGNYKDMFTWDDLYYIFKGSTAPSSAADIGTTAKNIDGENWYTISTTIGEGFISGAGRTKLNTIWVGAYHEALGAYAQIDLQGSPYEGYPLYKSTKGMIGKDVVFGRFLFPDGYVDMTDVLDASSATPSNYTTRKSFAFISYDAYEQMVDAGVVFLIDSGIYYSGEYIEADGKNLPYWLRNATSASVANRLIGGIGASFVINTASRSIYRSVRLCKIATDPNWNSIPGYSNGNEIDW